MKIMVADDESHARQRLCRLLSDLGYQYVSEASNGEQVLQQYQQDKNDVILLDIRMPGLDGLAVAKRLSEQPHPPAIIFTTAYSEHAMDAFDVYALDYLLKPIKKARLQRALEMAQRLQRVADNPETADHEIRDYLCVRVRGNLQRVAIADVYYFRAEQKYVSVRHKNGEVLIEDSLKSLEHEFAGQFCRVHRNGLVAKRYLAGMEKDREGHWYVTFQGIDERLEISRRHVPAIRKQFKANG